MDFADDSSAPNDERGNVACGLRCLALAAILCDNRQPTNTELERAFHGNLSGTHSYQELEAAARALGYKTRLVHLTSQNARLLRQPLIVCKYSPERRQNHCVLVYGSWDNSFHVIDYPRSPRLIPASVFAESWDGWGLYVAERVSSLWTTREVLGHVGDFALFIGSIMAFAMSLRSLCARKSTEHAQ